MQHFLKVDAMLSLIGYTLIGMQQVIQYTLFK